MGNNKTKSPITKILKFCLGLGVFFSSVVSASSPLLEEVIVTAQKREESLQDVPISVNAVSGEFIEKSGINDLKDLSLFVPNLNIIDTNNSSQIVIRGLGSGASNQSFENSVGLYVDGIYSSRGPQFLIPFLDVERVEVLRGPQGVLFGKNSIAGAVSIVSAQPKERKELKISASYELEHGGIERSGIVSGQISENLLGRVALKDSVFGEYLKNEFKNEKVPSGTSNAIRTSFLWQASDTLEAFLKLEHADLERKGIEYQLSYLDPDRERTPFAGIDIQELINQVLTGNVEAYTSTITNILGENLFNIHKNNGEDFKFDDSTHINEDTVKNIKSDNLALNIRKGIGDYELTYVYGWSRYAFQQAQDLDFGPADFMSRKFYEEYQQYSHELRLASALGETFEYTYGLYYIDRNLNFPKVRFDSYVLLDPGYFGMVGDPFIGPGTHTLLSRYDEESKALSGFMQVTWNISDMFRATLGARYTKEKKSVLSSQGIYEAGSETVLASSTTVNVIKALPVNVNAYNFDKDRTENSFDPTFNLQWNFNEDILLYYTWATATKAGGFNASDTSGVEDEYEYEEEHAVNHEIGAKIEIPDVGLRFNAAIFRTGFDDLQVSTFDGTNFRTGNAAKAITQGIEFDTLYAINSGSLIGGNFAYLDATYDDFIGGCSTNKNQWSADCWQSNGREQDLAGERLDLAPEYSASIFLDMYFPVSVLILNTRIDVAYSDKVTFQADLDDHNAQEAFTKANLRLALMDAEESWDVSFTVTNLTDKRTKGFTAGVLLIPGLYFSSISEGRLYTIGLKARFGD